jgi:hypothetical protein
MSAGSSIKTGFYFLRAFLTAFNNIIASVRLLCGDAKFDSAILDV